ncbi:MAG: methylenetetrahydrofolate reductase, partial [Alphaproteobacteria bacterium]
MARAPAEKPETEAQGGLHADFLRGFSIETLPVSSSEVAALAAQLPPGTEVYIGWPSSRGPGYIIDAARQLRAAGHRPVPHIAARRVTSRDDLAGFLRRLTTEAGVDQVLVVGGQPAEPVGPFHAALQIFETGLLEEFGIRRIGVAGHPEGHPAVAREDLVVALREKIDHGKRTGADIHVVT